MIVELCVHTAKLIKNKNKLWLSIKCKLIGKVFWNGNMISTRQAIMCTGIEYAKMSQRFGVQNWRQLCQLIHYDHILKIAKEM